MSSRPPPPPRSALHNRLQKTIPYDLRGVLAFFAVLAVAWGGFSAYAHFNDVNDEGETQSMKSADIVLGILSLVVLGIAIFCIGAVTFQKIFLSRLVGILGPLGALLAFGTSIMALIFHFTLKNSMISQCVTELMNADLVNNNRNGTTTPFTEAQAARACTSDWDRGTWRDVIWVVITLLLGFLFTIITFWYHKQQLDPSLIRRSPRFQPNPGPSAYQMNGMPAYQTGPPQGYQQQQGWVPPYPGPPPPGSQFAPTPAYGEKGGEVENTYEAQEEAWRRAQAGGPTEHFTGSGGAGGGLSYGAGTGGLAGGYQPPQGPPPGQGGGYTIPNEEEDEAWERARREGVTAHLTGGKLGEGGVGK